MTKKCISVTFDLSDMLLSLHIGLALSKLQWLVQSLRELPVLSLHVEAMAPMYLKLVTVPNFCPLTLISLWMPLALLVITLVVSSLISILYLVQVLSRLSARASNFCFSSARTSVLSANRRLVIILSLMLTLQLYSSEPQT